MEAVMWPSESHSVPFSPYFSVMSLKFGSRPLTSAILSYGALTGAPLGHPVVLCSFGSAGLAPSHAPAGHSHGGWWDFIFRSLIILNYFWWMLRNKDLMLLHVRSKFPTITCWRNCIYSNVCFFFFNFFIDALWISYPIHLPMPLSLSSVLATSLQNRKVKPKTKTKNQ